MLERLFTPLTRARVYNRQIPPAIRSYLTDRGIPDATIDEKLLGWNGRRITIPVFDREGEVVCFRYAKSPTDPSDSPKMISDARVGAELYGWETLAATPARVVICEGEFDRLVLEARGVPAVTSTAGANAFRPEWASHFEPIADIFICFDRDATGAAAARKVQKILPRARIVKLPAEVGIKGDISDYFVRLQKTVLDFELLLAAAAPATDRPAVCPPRRTIRTLRPAEKAFRRRAQRLKAAIPLHEVVQLYTSLRASGGQLVAHCPFHDDRRPSFTVYPDTDTYYCFGCAAHGDLVQFLMQKESMTFNEALAALERFDATHELFGTA